MSAVSSYLKNLSSFLQNHQVSFSNGLLILFTIGGEQIFKDTAFKCPCTQPAAYYYSLIFMAVPALVLWIIGVAVSNLTWRVFHGCCKREVSNGCWISCEYLTMILSRAAVVPCAWLFIALLNGDYYACMLVVESPCMAKKNNTEEYKSLVAESQAIGWICLGILVLISFAVICIVRCCLDSVTYLQFRFINSYREAEQDQFDALIQESTEKLAEDNARGFINEKELNKQDWDDISRISNPVTILDVPDNQDLPKDTLLVLLKKITKSQGQPKETSKSTKSQVSLTHLHEWVKSNKKDTTLPAADRNTQREQHIATATKSSSLSSHVNQHDQAPAADEILEEASM